MMDGCFARRVRVRFKRRDREPVHRADVDDPSGRLCARARFEQRQQRPREHKRRADVHVEHFVERVCGVRRKRLGPVGPRIVDKNVDLRLVRGDLGYKRKNLFLARDVGADRTRDPGRDAFELDHRRVAFALRPRSDVQPTAAVRHKRFRDHETDAAGAAGNDRDATLHGEQ
eukprot:Amastigsp_a2008_49.p3 type:complete len:172 gc:universal Amastigsp_a2008_49:337-852(+)